MNCGFSEEQIEAIKHCGYTSESARSNAKSILKKANLCKDEMKRFDVPFEEMSECYLEIIVSLMSDGQKDVDNWIDIVGKDFSKPSDWMNFVMYYTN